VIRVGEEKTGSKKILSKFTKTTVGEARSARPRELPSRIKNEGKRYIIDLRPPEGEKKQGWHGARGEFLTLSKTCYEDQREAFLRHQ